MNNKRKLKEYISQLDTQQFKLFYSIFVHYWVKHKAFISNQNFLNLWCELNLICSEVDESFPDPYDRELIKEYEGLCHVIIDMIEGKAYLKYDDRIALAELYRNVGEFEKCILLLDFFKKPNVAEKYIERIRGEAIKKNKATVIVE